MTMKLTFEIFQEPETPHQWTAHCEELDIISAHTLPEVAIEALAEAVRMTLEHAMKQGLSCVVAFEAIKTKVDARRWRDGTSVPTREELTSALVTSFATYPLETFLNELVTCTVNYHVGPLDGDKPRIATALLERLAAFGIARKTHREGCEIWPNYRLCRCPWEIPAKTLDDLQKTGVRAVYYHYECSNPSCHDAVVLDVRTSGDRPYPCCPSCGIQLEWSASTPCDVSGRASSPWMLAPRLRMEL